MHAHHLRSLARSSKLVCWPMLLSSLRAAALALTLATCANAHAQAARTEVHAFRSITMTDQQFLSGSAGGTPVTIAGELRLPRAGTDRLPLVILLHGSGGISAYVTDWEQTLLSLGVATFVIDSFTARGLTSVNNDQSLLGRLAQTFDAYRALELLEKHPRIDPARIALMGFSRGGQDALYASLKRFQRMHGPASGRTFAAYLAFYPSCNTAYRADEDVAPGPIRIFHGSADDYAPIAPCRAYVARLKSAGKDVELTEYAGAQHVFDGRAFAPAVKLAQAQTTRRCHLEEAADGSIVNAETGKAFTDDDPCVERGPTIAYDEPAAEASRRAIAEFVKVVLRP